MIANIVWNQGSVLRRNCEITAADSREIGIKIRVRQSLVQRLSNLPPCTCSSHARLPKGHTTWNMTNLSGFLCPVGVSPGMIMYTRCRDAWVFRVEENAVLLPRISSVTAAKTGQTRKAHGALNRHVGKLFQNKCLRGPLASGAGPSLLVARRCYFVLGE